MYRFIHTHTLAFYNSIDRFRQGNTLSIEQGENKLFHISVMRMRDEIRRKEQLLIDVI